MSLFDACPLATPLPPIPLQSCGVNYGQIQKIAFWRKGQTPFTNTTILLSASWATAVALTTIGAVTMTNFLTNFNIPVTTAVEQAADTNINAIPELQRGAPIKGTFMSRSLSAADIQAMQSYTPYTQVQPGVTQLGFVMINQDNQVIFNDNGGDLLFPMFNFFTSDNDIKGQLGALNDVMSEFYVLYAWTKNIKKAQMAFDFLNTYPAT